MIGSIGVLKYSDHPSENHSTEKLETFGGQKLDMSRNLLQSILTKDLLLHDCKVQLAKELKPSDHAQRKSLLDGLWNNNKCMEHKYIVQRHADFSKTNMFNEETHLIALLIVKFDALGVQKIYE